MDSKMSFVRLFVCSFSCSFVRSFELSFILSFACRFVCLLVRLIHSSLIWRCWPNMKPALGQRLAYLQLGFLGWATLQTETLKKHANHTRPVIHLRRSKSEKTQLKTITAHYMWTAGTLWSHSGSKAGSSTSSTQYALSRVPMRPMWIV